MHSTFNFRRLLLLLATVAAVLSACGSEPVPLTAPVTQAGESAAAPAVATEAPAPAAAPAEAAVAAAPAPAQEEAAVPLVSIAESAFGDILVNGAGLSLYGFTNDADGLPTCEGGCAEAWPPILVEGGVLPADLDPSVFSVVSRPDGTSQLKAGKWPLYLFAGDAAPGQTTGHLSGDVWFLATPDGKLVDFTPPADQVEAAVEAPAAAPEAPVEEPAEEAAAAAPVVTTAVTGEGEILVDENGFALYGFTNDEPGVSNCVDGCAQAWPPVLVATAAVPDGLDTDLFSVITRSDGGFQLQAGIWPLYLFGGDTAAGQTTGQGSGGVWFVVAPDGKLVGVPAAPVAEPAQPAAPAQPAPVQPAPAQPAPAQPAPTATPVPPAPAPTPVPPSNGYGAGGGYGSGGSGGGYGDSDY